MMGKFGPFVQRLGCGTVYAEIRVRFPYGPPNTEVWQSWLIAPVLKTGIPEMVSGVRIPHLPHLKTDSG